ncbi:hypothetical protein [Sorangium sp. So ce128]|uniref:hypothetical protein n=1 Tax=Sorangium sp. So ce128 TaxID=3133281 RepID=UPI003F63F7DE
MKKEVKGRCGLHGEDSDLHDSHILPRWAYRRAKESPSGQIVALKNDCVMFDERQLSEHLLCFACEQRLGIWDKYAADMSRQDGGFIALESVTLIPGLGHGDTKGADASNLDVETLARFGAAVFFRASLCSKLPTISLGKYEHEFRECLLGKADFPSNARLILQLLRGAPDEPTDQTFGFCGSLREHGYHLHGFVVFGLWYNLFVGQQLPPSTDQLCLVRTSRVMIGPSNALLLGLGAPLATRPRKGKMATLYR